ncbi:MAG: hypothetical protein A2365_01560 [Candidatus Nealsonbacteria bacterium RIFOXYB1_FULL_40_15]|uniref:histidine kinase n=2 Tax=Candidatus Nealsoniibacteriota TaxID=1817911 RepID=A0A1G2EMC2_9BACT|nr:MAG: hypothetical protein A2427_00100 [Candidatus Nealsonbacteria bacterium RIFOXYC1_FULL_40_7]OGZ27259.1 MAG: hypothetical protein A2365_01560 [Candidatus Nealsonbacteria bacterium RIFOXYB1_FULL_40_15]OGZ29958.1 MAG: hypothetical protein A2562_02825 [Candidatus Nealsonbacteria bacterium RIFOXYD1_FULL_39_11]
MKKEDFKRICISPRKFHLLEQKEKKIEGEIARLNEFNRQIVQNGPVSIMVIDRKGNIIFTNDYYKILSNLEFPIGRNIFKLPFFKREELISEFKKLFKAGGIIKKNHCESVNLKGKTIYINITAVPLKDERGRTISALSMAVDVTETVIAQQKLRKLNVELEEKVSQRTKELEKSLELKKQFISDASHELRTPLTIIRLNMELLQKELKEKKVVDSINREIDKISEILEDLSLLTAIDEGRERIRINALNLNSLVSNTAKRIKSLLKEKRIKLFLFENSHNLVVKGDKVKLEKLFLNIIRNAIKYGSRGGWIRIRIKSKDGFAEVSVADNGIGISKEELPRIFERFYRANLSRSKGESGFGLGLAICKWVADRHNGSISVKSEPGKGSVFSIKLPLT